jgi:hypothetical protein
MWRAAPDELWSRNARLLDDEWLEAVRGERERYVLKRGVDTRGEGVLVGAGMGHDDWDAAVRVTRQVAAGDGWVARRRTTRKFWWNLRAP